MSYQVLARKYRPQAFQEMAGQEHVLRALVNALEHNRLHHAYLFTGTRGVGKTSIARLFAKCLNCEQGVSANPCGTCNACQEIASGRFLDLLEIDAASRTKVEDTRDLLENVQYAPTRGRYKVYLIDEVHMLSGHSFNALLKTLEEPPPHVKFLLATTDPQRLPVTVLSRCLQFNLKDLAPERIQAQLTHVLDQEKIPYETSALLHLARAANGSLRDALSLLDQAIAYGNNQLVEKDVRTMLGSIEQTHIIALLEATAANDGTTILALIQQLAEQAADFHNVLEEILTTLHQIAILQIVPDAFDNTLDNYAAIKNLAQALPREDVQLYYQIALIGRRDLPLAPTPRSGFEMLLLRMLAFHPVQISGSSDHPPVTQQKRNTPPVAVSPSIAADKSAVPVQPAATPPAAASDIHDLASQWPTLVTKLNLTGFTQAFALNCIVKEFSGSSLHLELDPSQSALRSPKQEARIAEALSAYFGKPFKLQTSIGTQQLLTPARLKQNQQTAQLAALNQELASDPNVQMLVKTFDAQLKSDSIQTKTPAMLSELETQ